MDAEGWLVLPADLPLISPTTLQAVALALTKHQVVVPFHAAQRGHPVGFAASCRTDLLNLQGDEGARGVVARYGFTRLAVDDEGAVLDVDTVQALAQAAQRLSQTRIN
jgi:molybdenum cofactor cytidylyltransferase